MSQKERWDSSKRRKKKYENQERKTKKRGDVARKFGLYHNVTT